MRDRLPTYPGRVRLIAVDEENHIYDLERADEATQQGTPLNKNTLLRDETVARFGGNSDMTVDAAINAIMDEVGLKIGDVVRTTGDIPDGWLPMDGTQILVEDYPELYKLRAYNGHVNDGVINSVSKSNARERIFLKKINGYYVGFACGTLIYSSGAGWSKRDLTSALLETHHKLGYTDILWDDVNDQWLILAGMKATDSTSSSISRFKLFKMPTLSATPVKVFDDQNYSGGESPVYIHKEGSYFVANDNAYDNASAMNHRARVYITTDPNNEEWTDLADLTIGALRYKNSITYADGRYIVGGDINEGDTQAPAYAYSKKGEDLLNATWTTKKLGDGVASGTPARYILVNNIVWMPKCGAFLFACGEQGGEDTAHYYVRHIASTLVYTTTKAIGGTTNETLYVDGILYTPSGAYRDDAKVKGDPLSFDYEDAITYPEQMTEDGFFARWDTDVTNRVRIDWCIKTLPDLGANDGLIYKIKARGAIFTGDDDPGYTPDWSDIDFTDPDNDGNIVITIGGN